MAQALTGSRMKEGSRPILSCSANRLSGDPHDGGRVLVHEPGGKHHVDQI